MCRTVWPKEPPGPALAREVSQARSTASTSLGPSPARRGRLTRRIRLLVAATLTYNVIEAVVALAAGAAASSTALIAFGLDSVIEVSSAAAVSWQFSAREHAMREARERTTLRIIAISFFVLAACVTVDAVRALAGAGEADRSLTGIVIAVLSLAVMPFLSAAQRRAGQELGSASAVADSKQTLLCTYLSGVLLVGLVVNATLGWPWADPVAALVIAAVAVKEGRDTLREIDQTGRRRESSQVSSPLERSPKCWAYHSMDSSGTRRQLSRSPRGRRGTSADECRRHATAASSAPASRRAGIPPQRGCGEAYATSIVSGMPWARSRGAAAAGTVWVGTGPVRRLRAAVPFGPFLPPTASSPASSRAAERWPAPLPGPGLAARQRRVSPLRSSSSAAAISSWAGSWRGTSSAETAPR